MHQNWHNQIRQWPNIAHNLVSSLLATLFLSIIPLPIFLPPVAFAFITTGWLVLVFPHRWLIRSFFSINIFFSTAAVKIIAALLPLVAVIISGHWPLMVATFITVAFCHWLIVAAFVTCCWLAYYCHFCRMSLFFPAASWLLLLLTYIVLSPCCWMIIAAFVKIMFLLSDDCCHSYECCSWSPLIDDCCFVALLIFYYWLIVTFLSFATFVIFASNWLLLLLLFLSLLLFLLLPVDYCHFYHCSCCFLKTATSWLFSVAASWLLPLLSLLVECCHFSQCCCFFATSLIVVFVAASWMLPLCLAP